jgi:hypothetical protein
MSTDLNIHLNPETFVALQQAAIATGRTPSEEAASAVEQKFGAPNARSPLTDQEARQRFERHFGTAGTEQNEAEAPGARLEDFFGTVRFGYKGGVTNEQIDADLAREYGRTHDGD